MADLFHVMLMERLGDNAEWTKFLRASFEANAPWDAMVRKMLRADPKDTATPGASFWLSKRLENYGQNPVDYSGLTRDVGRLFLGKNFQCCECHDHLFIDDYKQADFQGLFAFVQNVALATPNPPADCSTTGRPEPMPWRLAHSSRFFGSVKTGWIGMPVTVMSSRGTPQWCRYAAPSSVAVV